MDSLEAYRPLVERLAEALGPADPTDDADEPMEPDDPMAGMFAGMLADVPADGAGHDGGIDGRPPRAAHLRPVRPADPAARHGPDADELLLVVPNLDAFADEWSLPRGRPPAVDLRARGRAPRGARRAPRAGRDGRPPARSTSSSFRNDPGALEDRIGEIDLADPAALAKLQEVIGSPDVILGAITSPEQDALRPQLEALVAVVVGVVDHVRRRRRRRAHRRLPDAHRGAAPPAGRGGRGRPLRRAAVRPRAQPGHLRPGQHLRGRRARAGRRGRPAPPLGAAPSMLPTPAEVDAPGLWLARIDL